MANRIKGITIELDGNTTKLDKALEGVNKTVRKTQSELRDVNRLLKMDPKNTELLQQKQRLLSEAIEGTKEKLEQEKKALEQLKESGKTKDNQRQQDALQREIVETTGKLQKLEEEQRKLGNMKLDQLAKQFEKVGEKMTSVGDTLTKSVTAPLLAIGGASLMAFNEVDAGLDIVVKKTGATGEALEDMKDIVLDLATEMPVTFEEAGAAVGEINTRFGLTGTELDDLSAKFLKFAQLNSKDVSSSIDEVQKALAAYGLDASHASDYLDVLNKVAQDTGVDVSKLTSGIVSNGAAFQEMGLDIYQATIFMGKLEKSGANSETVLNGMRKALKNASAEGKDLNEALAELEDAILNGTDDMTGLQMAYELFGKSGDQVYAALKNGTISFKDLGAAALDASGNIETTYTNMLDPIDQAKMAMNAMKEAGYELGGALAEVILPVLKKVTQKVKDFSRWFKRLSPQTKEMIVKVGGLVAALGPLLSITGRITSKMGGMISALPNLIGKLKGVGGAGGTASSGLLSVITKLVPKEWLAVAAAAGMFAGVLIKVALAATQYTRQADKLLTAHEQEIQSIEAQYGSAEMYVQKLDELSQKENKSATDKKLMQTYVDQLNSSVKGLNLSYDAEKDKLNMSKDAIYEKIDALKQMALAQAYQNQMNELATQIVQNEMEMEALKTAERQKLAEIEAETDSDRIAVLNNELDQIRRQEDNLTAAQSQMYASMDVYAQRASGNMGTLSGDFKKLEVAAQEAGIEIPQWLRDGIDTGKYEIPKSIDELKSLVASETNDLGRLFNTGTASGIREYMWQVADQARQMVISAMTAAKQQAEIKSPSRLFKRVIGENIGLGVAEGIEDSESAVDQSAIGLMNSTQRAMLQTSPTATVNVAGAYDIASDMAGALNTVMRANTAGGGQAPVIYLTTYLYPNGPEMGHQIVKAYDTYKGRLG